MLAGMQKLMSHRSAPPGRRLATVLVVPFLLIVALVGSLAMSGCSGGSPDAAAAGAPERSAPPRLLECPTRIEGERIILGGDCDETVTEPDRVFETDVEALAAASLTVKRYLTTLLAAHTDNAALDRIPELATSAMAADRRAAILEQRANPRPDDILPAWLSFGPIGLVEREPLGEDAVGMAEGVRVAVKVCWVKHFEDPRLDGEKTEPIESYMTLVDDGTGLVPELRVEWVGEWVGERVC